MRDAVRRVPGARCRAARSPGVPPRRSRSSPVSGSPLARPLGVCRRARCAVGTRAHRLDAVAGVARRAWRRTCPGTLTPSAAFGEKQHSRQRATRCCSAQRLRSSASAESSVRPHAQRPHCLSAHPSCERSCRERARSVNPVSLSREGHDRRDGTRRPEWSALTLWPLTTRYRQHGGIVRIG
jgi:hypothetical protein